MSQDNKTLRLLMPQWQGGDKPTYQLGAKLLAWLAPESSDPCEEVPVIRPDGHPLPIENDVVGKSQVLDAANSARAIIERHAPDRIVTFGGDCGVSLAPFSYLAAKYDGNVAILWVDTHPDVDMPTDYGKSHAHALANLLDDGDPDLAAFAKTTIPGSRVLYAGLNKEKLAPAQRAYIERIGATMLAPSELDADFANVVDWIKASGASKLLVHFDLDVLDPQAFRSQLFNPIGGLSADVADHAQGSMTFAQVIDLLSAASTAADVVALSVTEHLPWDAENLQNALRKLPLLR